MNEWIEEVGDSAPWIRTLVECSHQKQFAPKLEKSEEPANAEILYEFETSTTNNEHAKLKQASAIRTPVEEM